jgi:hypothetical protein
MRAEKEFPRASSRTSLRTGTLIAIGAFLAGIGCTALVALELLPLAADDMATT